MFSSDEKGFGKRHFVIKYNTEKKNYFLKDLEDGTGTFIKIAPKMVLKNNTIISFGDIHFAIVFPPAKSAEADPKDSKS